MYKIYINEIPLILVEEEEAKAMKRASESAKVLYARYTGKTKHLFNYMDLLEKGGGYEGIVIYHDNLELLKNSLFGLLKTIPAAGGLVKSKEQNFLMIYRFGKWDLPKGKIEGDEKSEEAALREVKEETGIKDIFVDFYLGKSYHIYRSPRKGIRCLKVTDWYAMLCLSEGILSPQTEEGISEAQWASWEKVMSRIDSMFRNIEDTFLMYQKLSGDR
jgi:ADP-ribose pyrophosphatase YjhB (NUDIX family)